MPCIAPRPRDGRGAGSASTYASVNAFTFAVNGGNLTTSQTTFNLVNATATTVNFAGAASQLNIGSVAGTAVIASVITASSGIIINGPSEAILGTPKTTASIFNTTATTINFAGAATNISVGAAGSGATYLKNSTLFVSGATTFGASVIPSQDVTYDLGSPTARWANMYTGDLHLKNDRGDWTIIEEPDFLTITNNKNGKRYKFVMEEIG